MSLHTETDLQAIELSKLHSEGQVSPNNFETVLRKSSYAEPVKHISTAAPEYVFKTPFGLNRWVIFTAFSLYAFVVGPTFFSWASLRDMFYISGAYGWLCDPDETNPEADSYIPRGKQCKNQIEAVGLLYTLISSALFISSAFAGVILDKFGPRIVSAGGTLLQMIGWLLISTSTRAFQMYIPGMLLIGMGTDAAFFGTLCASALFPGNSSSVIAVFGACRSASFYVPLIMEKIMSRAGVTKMTGVGCWFVGLFLLPSLIMTITLMPNRRFKVIIPDSVESLPIGADSEIENSKAGAEKDSEMRYNCTAPDLTDEDRTNRTTADTPKSDRVDLEAEQEPAQVAGDMGKLSLKTQSRQALSYVISPYYWPVALVVVMTLQRVVFFGGATGALMSASPMEVFKYVSPLSFLPCPLLGYMADKCGIMSVMFITNLAGTGMLVFSMIPGIVAAEGSQYVAIICYVVHVAFLLSQVYCYIEDTFDPGHLGKLVGFACSVGGLVTLINIPLDKYCLDNGYLGVMTFEVVISVLCFGLLGFTWYWKRTRGRRANITF